VSDTASATSSDGGPPRADRPAARRGGLIARIALFVRQVVGELRKVVRPTRQELFTYIGVVVVFVIVVMAFVGVLDLGFGRLVLWIFG
jgi:preprotein translocase subunit SecE